MIEQTQLDLISILVNFLSPAGAIGPVTGYIAMPPVCPSVMFSFHSVTQKTHCCIFSKLCRYVHQVVGVCCIVFDIDGMLFEFCMIFFYISSI